MSAAEAVVVPFTKNSPRNTADIIKRMFEVRSERREIGAKDKELVAEWEELVTSLKAKMLEQGEDINSVSSKLGTATLTETTQPNVEDWDAFYEYILEKKAFHLLQRRVAAGAFREIIDAGEEVPGVRPVKKQDIGLTAARS